MGRADRHQRALPGAAPRAAVVCLALPAGDAQQSTAWTASTITLAQAAGLVLCLALVAVALVLLRRHRRQIDELMARLDRVEPEVDDPSSVHSLGGEPLEPEDPESSISTRFQRPVGDVLAGRTSYVEAMVAGAPAESKSLGDQVILCIHDNLHRPLTPSQLADELRVSLRTLQRVLEATLDCTPSQLILAMKMRAARRLLLSGDYRVNEVAYRLGFASPAHFSTRFRSFYREPPSRLIRRAHRGSPSTDTDRAPGPVN